MRAHDYAIMSMLIFKQFIYITTLDQCVAQNLTLNPIVATWSIDAVINVDDQDTPGSSTTKRSSTEKADEKRRRRLSKHVKDDTTKEKRSLEDLENGNTTAGNYQEIQGRELPTSQSLFKLQQSSPGHLQWLSTLSRYTHLSGEYLSFDNLLYNDPTTQESPIIYVIDTGFNNFHQVSKDSFLDLDMIIAR